MAEVREEAASVVLRGGFNPSLFSLQWLASRNLVSDEDLLDARQAISTREYSTFELPWLLGRTTPDSLELRCREPVEYQRLHDLAMGALTLLEETPVDVMGMNRFFHFELRDVEAWHKLGDKLVPKVQWENILKLPGMRSLSLEGAREDGRPGAVRVKVEPSYRYNPGIFIEYNDHYGLSRERFEVESRADFERMGTQEIQASADRIPIAREILQEEFFPMLERAQQFADEVVSWSTER